MTSLIQTLLTMEGHVTTIVNDSTTAVETAAKVNPDVITLDLMMPGLTGFELCELLHQDPRFANVPIMIVSAKDDTESKAKAKTLGAKDYLTKPFSVDDLLEKIRELTTAPKSEE
jgi:DNA-binding response OmpR family regulator